MGWFYGFKLHIVINQKGKIIERVCNENEIEHRKTKVKHPWTNGQVERMNRTLKEATVDSFYYASHHQLKQHLHTYLMAYNFAKRLKAIKGKTPWQFILNQWTINPNYSTINPNHFTLGLNIYTKAHRPQTNGKIERFVQTSLREWAYAKTYQNSKEREKMFIPFLRHYNLHRPHFGIKGKT